MSQYPGGQPPQDPYYGQQGTDPYAPPPPQPSDPYFGQPGSDPYGQPQDPNAYAQQQQAYYYAQQQAYYAQQQAAQARREAADARGGQGGAGAAIVGLLLVLFGLWVLFGDEIDIELGEVWPIAAVALGIVMVIAAFIPRRSR